LSPWPVDRPRDWTERVNQPLDDGNVALVKTSLARAGPLGSVGWIAKIASRLDLEHTLRDEGQPKKTAAKKN
jgi:hypothetical protein